MDSVGVGINGEKLRQAPPSILVRLLLKPQNARVLYALFSTHEGAYIYDVP
jgi:hypothetical protein